MEGQLCYEDVSSQMKHHHSTLPSSVKCEKVPNPGRASVIRNRITFDPSGEGLSDSVEQSRSPFKHTFSPVPSRHGVKRGEKHLGGRDLEEDEGYSSPFLKNLNQSPRGVCSSPFLGRRATDLQPPESRYRERILLRGQDELFAAEGLDVIVSGPTLEHVDAPVSSLEDALCGSNIGLPLLESSMCDSGRVKLNDGSEGIRQVSKEVQERKLEPVGECRTTLVELDSNLDTAYEATFPLQVKVKCVPSSPPSQQSLHTTERREVDWEHEKRLYLDSVKKHISGNQGGNQDLMTELLTLMAGTNSSPDCTPSQPQHPSDFTCRNYQRRLRNPVPLVTLQEWQLQNYKSGKRFANVSKEFRSHFSNF